MTNEQAKALYLSVFPPADDEEAQQAEEMCDWDDLADEIRSVIDAPSDAAGGAIIEWWMGWGDYQHYATAEDGARALRREWKIRLAR